jgi:hypothetical protein
MRCAHGPLFGENASNIEVRPAGSDSFASVEGIAVQGIGVNERHSARNLQDGSSAVRWKPCRAAVGLAVVFAVLALSLSACGGGSGGPAVVHVGSAAIGKASVEHWMRVIERGGDFEGLAIDPNGTPRQRALAFLISSRWLDGEAARQGLSISGEAVDRAMSERKAADGSDEFQRGLDETGQSIDDVRLEIKSELEAAAINRELAVRAGRLAEPEIVSYYQSHRTLFSHHEVRNVELIEKLPSPSAARALVSRIGTGKRFSAKAFHEALARAVGAKPSPPERESVTNAIFVARQGVPSRPMRLGGAWTVFIVRKIIPGALKPLEDVRGEVVERLAAIRLGRIKAAFQADYRRRWITQTRCGPGYVVQGCARYAGLAEAPENPLASS